MPVLSSQSGVAVIPICDYTNIGSAIGTTTISSQPSFLHAITVTQRVASGSLVIYDSIGTSGTVIGTVTLGTQTFSDAPPTYIFDIRTKNALTVFNSANVNAVVSASK